MKLSSFAYLAGFGVRTVLFRRDDPILGTILKKRYGGKPWEC